MENRRNYIFFGPEKANSSPRAINNSGVDSLGFKYPSKFVRLCPQVIEFGIPTFFAQCKRRSLMRNACPHDFRLKYGASEASPPMTHPPVQGGLVNPQTLRSTVQAFWGIRTGIIPAIFAAVLEGRVGPSLL